MFDSLSARGESEKPRINRAPSPVLARGVPWLTVMLCSMVPGWLLIASAPVLPPFGFLAFVAWVQLRPGLLPIWAGLPLGLFDDLFNGQPFGSSVLLWSLSSNLLDYVERKLPWRNFLTEWLVAAALIAAYLLAGALLAHLDGGAAIAGVLAPQIVIAVLAYPIVARAVGTADRFRLRPIMVVR
ncbi:rod shape-determining protein MreD [Novosphingobium colocasiae]|uniref:rod shape-determining protein MreD n=1 Tax=Novosphingobium colocasiae TaxID=1256513 RepID=UPI0035B24DAD